MSLQRNIWASQIVNISPPIDPPTEPPGDSTIDNYIKDGLVFWLDGFDPPINSKWYNKISDGNYLNLTSVSHAGNRYVFDGISSKGKTVNRILLDTSLTVEIAFKQTAINKDYSYFISTSGISPHNMFYNNLTGKNVTYVGGVDNTSNTSMPNAKINLPHTFTITKAKSSSYFKQTIYQDYASPCPSIPSDQVVSSNYLSVGYNTEVNDFFFTGFIYSIRVYNRPISRSELYKNYNTDKKRFGF